MFEYFKNRKAEKARHIADVYQNQRDPAAYLRMEKALKWQPLFDILECLGFIVTAIILGIAAYVFLAVTP